MSRAFLHVYGNISSYRYIVIYLKVIFFLSSYRYIFQIKNLKNAKFVNMTIRFIKDVVYLLFLLIIEITYFTAFFLSFKNENCSDSQKSMFFQKIMNHFIQERHHFLRCFIVRIEGWI